MTKYLICSLEIQNFRKPIYIKKIPKLLNLVHKLIESQNQKFILTGSSARKLKRGAANLLAGRAYVYVLHPFTSSELKDRFDLDAALHWGTLPKILHISTDAEKAKYLRSYSTTYIKEEIIAEQLVKKLDPFREFLPVAAKMSGQILNYSKIARAVGAQTPTVQTYFQILEETYMGFILPHFDLSIRKSQLHAPKFYLFDNGVKKAIEGSLGSRLIQGSSEYGVLFEHWVIQEIFRLNQYHDKDYRLSYLRTKNKKSILVEIKSSSKIDEIEVNKLVKLKEDFPSKTAAYYLSQDPNEYEIHGVHCMHWKSFVDQFEKL